MEVLLLTFIRDGVARELGGTTVTLSLIPSAMFAGMFVGALVWGVVADTIGRRQTLNYLIAVQITGGACACVAPSLSFLILMRFVVGLGLGGGHVAPSLFMELLPARGREKWVIVTYAFWSVGAVVQCIAAYLLRDASWRVLTAVSVLPYVACVLMLRWCVESPKQLLLKGHVDEATMALRTVAMVCGKELPDDFVLTSRTVGSDASTAAASATQQSQQSQHVIFSLASHVRTATVLVCETPAMRWLSAVLWAVWMGTAFSYYGIIMVTTDAFIGGGSGGGGDGEGASMFQRYGSVTLMSAAELPFYPVMYWSAHLYGRKKPLVIWPLIGAAALLLFFALHTDAEAAGSARNLLALLFAFLVRGAVLIQFQIVSLYSPEAYPTRVRTAGTGACSAMARIATAVAPFIAYPLHDASPAAPYWVFAATLVLSGAAALGIPFETKDRVLDDVAVAVSGSGADTKQSHEHEQHRDNVGIPIHVR
jgi:MFS family permease